MNRTEPPSDWSEKLLDQPVPAKMTDERLEKIATLLARWKSGGLSEPESDGVEDFVYRWASLVCRLQGSTLVESFGKARAEFLAIAMAELEYLSHEELISRRLGCKTYQDDLEYIFDMERMKRGAPEFLKRYLNLCGFGIISDDLSVAASSIGKFLDSWYIHEKFLKKSISISPPAA